jgi:DNA polymerase IIIc chi subunit
MSSMTQPQIIFIPVKDNEAKLQAICLTVERHYLSKQRMLLAVSSDAAATYLDNLLWRLPETGMLPHRILNRPHQEAIAITTTSENLNGAEILFNLRIDIHPAFKQLNVVYELFDETSAEKKNQSLQHKAFYNMAL